MSAIWYDAAGIALVESTTFTRLRLSLSPASHKSDVAVAALAAGWSRLGFVAPRSLSFCFDPDRVIGKSLRAALDGLMERDPERVALEIPGSAAMLIPPDKLLSSLTKALAFEIMPSVRPAIAQSRRARLSVVARSERADAKCAPDFADLTSS